MEKYVALWKKRFVNAVGTLLSQKNLNSSLISDENIVVETPPDPSLGDIAFPMFPYSKILREAPFKIAEKLTAIITDADPGLDDSLSVVGPYLNVKLDRPHIIGDVIPAVIQAGEKNGANNSFAGKRVMVEFSCPNTNKPLHLGHLRNDALGMSVSKIIAKCGAEVCRVNLINDRGIHICKSMLAYMEEGTDSTPESLAVKSDHFVGDYYVRFAQQAKDDPQAETRARSLLKSWEEGDPEVRALWEKMNAWAINGIKQTYEDTNISFDRYYYESQTYETGRDEILKGLAQGIFYKKEDNSIWVDLTAYGLDHKVLLRSDGTSLYLTQDIGTAIMRAADWKFDRLVYVVASEQNYHFRVLFIVLGLLGHAWAEQLFHLSYGMVNLPEGKMKSREGTVVDADDLLAELTAYALEEINARERAETKASRSETAGKIALGALNYYLLAVSPQKDMIFNPKESLSFTGDTGPYLQYTGARLSGILRKFDSRRDRYVGATVDYSLLCVDGEWELVKRFADFPRIVERAATTLDPSLIASFLYECAKIFATYYHDNQVLGNDDPALVVSRIQLIRAFLSILKSGFDLVGIPFLESM